MNNRMFGRRAPLDSWSRAALAFAAILGLATAVVAAPAVVINEIHYHPVEKAAFTTNGAPVLDLSEDVHEFIELFNNGTTNVSLAGWRLAGEINFDFPTNAAIGPGRYVVIAKDKTQLLSISQYTSLNATNVLGPYHGQLGNGGGTVRLRDSLDNTVDSVGYSAKSPWAIGADALGADDEWTGLNSSNYQYRGRSLERVSATWPANDPANWLASPAPGNPSPGRANAVTRAVPRPVVTAFAAYQDNNSSAIIRANQAARIDCTFSSTDSLSGALVEYFLDDINSTNETRFTVSMSVTGAPSAGRFTALLPGRPDRTIVRYRIRANRGGGLETVSPRADDPFAWHGYFVTPVRTSTNRIYECFISTASLNTLATNIGSSAYTNWENRRITQPNPPGYPRTSWNATEPAVVVCNGEVYDIQMRHHASQYHRDPIQNSFKWQFPRYKDIEGRSSMYVTSKTAEWWFGAALFRAAGLPMSNTRWVDLYLNNNSGLVRMEQDEMDDVLAGRWANEQAQANPGTPPEAVGEFYKAQGIFLFEEPEGPYGYGGFRRLNPVLPWWTEHNRYEWTYALQMHGWKGYNPFEQVLQGLWTARGDSPANPSPNVPALRAFLEGNFDVDEMLTYCAIRSWNGVWDDFNHNWFLWRRAYGRWGALPWDFDLEAGLLSTLQQPLFTQTNASIYLGEYGVATPYWTPYGIVMTCPTCPCVGDSRGCWTDANWLKDSFYKAFRQEYKQKLFTLNNTLLNPTNISAMGFTAYRSYANARFASVNSQVSLGAFTRPTQPTNVAPPAGQAALPPFALTASPYRHSANPAPAQASTTWFIRSAVGNYAAPVFKTISTSNLTSLPIPFEALTFGETYYWKCTYTDTNGHPSIDSAETPFVYGANPTLAPLISIDGSTLWRYNQGGTNPPSNWKTINFDDSSWPQGAALLADDTSGLLPEPIRTVLTRGAKVTFYFRNQFTFPGDPAHTFLRLRQVVDDGVVIYLNGVEILRAGMPAGTITNSTTASRVVATAVYEGPYILFPTNLIAGTNVLAAEVHRNSGASAVAFGLTLEASVPPMPGSIALNEIMADNRSAVTNGGHHPDYIELFNTTEMPQNLNGLSLSDDVTRPGKYIFPPGVVIDPSGFLVVWCDNETNSPGLHTGFALDNDGQTVALFTASTNGYQVSDSVTFGLQAADFAVGRAPAGTGPWQLMYATPGSENIGVATASPAGLRINEWMATDADGPDWLEIYNPSNAPVALAGLFLSDDFSDPAKSPIAPLSFIGAGGFRQFLADNDPDKGARHLNFKLSGSGEQIGLYDASHYTIDAVVFGPQISGVSEGRLPDGSETIVSFPTTASPEEANYLPLDSIVINEVLSHSDPPLEDAVELFNPTGSPVDISGWWLSDDKGSLRKFQITAPAVVPAGGFLVLYEIQFNSNPNLPTSFAFSSAHGDAVYLAAADAGGILTGYRAGAKFDPAESGASFGRFQTSQGVEFVALSQRTFGADSPATVEEFRTGPGAPNAYAKVGPVVISEIQFHPPDLTDGSDNVRDEFIELRNISGSSVPLFDPAAATNRWRLRDAVDYTFPPDTTLAADETVLVVSFDPATNAAALAEFRDVYGSVNARLFGPFSGKLDNSSDSVELVKPDSPVAEPGADYGFVPSILVDKVKYQDAYPWPETADGTGASIMRRVLTAYGNDPTNWFAWVATPGAENIYNQLPTVSLATPGDGATFAGPTNILLTANASDVDGTIARVEFFDGTNKLTQVTSAPFTFVWSNASFGPHTLTAKARDNGNAVALSAPVNIRVLSRPPVVAITTPTNGAIYAASNTVPLAVNATDPDTPVSKVEFFVDSAKIAEVSSAPYATNWLAVAGPHALTAVATDSTGVISTSAVVSIFVQAVAYTDTIIVASNSFWRYFDQGTDQGTAWTNLNFSDNTWGNGMAELGYGDDVEVPPRPEATVISYGPDPNNKYITYYFRQKFILPATDFGSVTLRVMRDDGAIAYLNGLEVFRDNMPAGAVNYLTPATTAVAGAGEFTFYPTNISPSRLVAGTNILAVEVHQQSGISSDVSFAAELRGAHTLFGPAILSQPASRTTAAGETATFTVNATGTAPLYYQWRFNGALLSDKTNDTLVLTNVQTALAGAYSVLVTNAVSSVASDVATLTIGELDSDGDGIPDAWEIAFGLDPFDEFDAFSDNDRDGMSNWAEYIAGTNPTNALSYLKIDSLTFGRAAVLTFLAASNTTYTVEYTDALGSGSWLQLKSVTARATNRFETIADATSAGSRFYRIATAQQPQTALRIDSLTTARAATLSFNAVSNKNYSVEYTDNPGGNPWRKLTDVQAQTVNRTATVADPSPAQKRFYRLVTPGTP